MVRVFLVVFDYIRAVRTVCVRAMVLEYVQVYYHCTMVRTRESVQNSDLHVGGGVTSNKSGIQMLQTTPQIHQSPP
jgi:hypothetical protein